MTLASITILKSLGGFTQVKQMVDHDMEQSRPLSRREKEVVYLLLQGKSNKQIALSLNVSERTVEFHLKNVYSKLQVNSRVELILLLGKTTGLNLENLRETTVDGLKSNVHNGKQPNLWAQPLKNIILTIKEEFAMMKNTILKSVEIIFDKHPLSFVSLLFLLVSFLIRYIVIDIGLYFWLSYLTLGMILLAGSIYLGVLWHKTVSKENHPTLYKILAFAIMPPAFVALVDVILRCVVARLAGQVSITVFGISNKLILMNLPSGYSYFYTERVITNDHLWLYTVLSMCLVFTVSLLINSKKSQNYMVSF